MFQSERDLKWPRYATTCSVPNIAFEIARVCDSSNSSTGVCGGISVELLTLSPHFLRAPFCVGDLRVAMCALRSQPVSSRD